MSASMKAQVPSAPAQAIGALIAYAAVSLAFFGLPVVRDPAHVYIGRGDATLIIWFLAWWPYALLHRLNPLVTHLVWAPAGVSLGWTTAVPGLGLVAAPVTLTAGPVVAYNVLCLLAPALAAWTAYLLCRRITGRFWPALVGGYVFGFSTYELGHLPGNLNLTMTALVPLAVLLVVRRVEGTLGPGRFTLLLTLALLGQLLISAEVFATMSVFAAMTLAAGVLVGPAKMRRRLLSAGALVLVAYAMTAVAGGPYLGAMLAHDIPRAGFFPSESYSSDLANFVFPTPITWLGGPQAVGITRRFLGSTPLEEVAYIGLPLLAVFCWFSLTRWREPAGRVLVSSTGLLLVATLGPTLHVAGASTIDLPWRFVQRLPLINTALPARFMLYVFLALAVVTAIWLSAGGAGARIRWALAAMAIASLLPNLTSANWRTAIDTPAFFEAGLYRRHLTPGENVLIVPYGSTGNSMLWQAETRMYFRMAGGFVGPATPAEFARWPIVYTLYFGTLLPDAAEQLRAFLSAHHVTAIVVAPSTADADAQRVFLRGQRDALRVMLIPQRATDWQRRLFGTLGVPPIDVGGVALYRVPSDVAGSEALTPLEMDRQASLAQFSALVAAAEAYRARGGNLAELTPAKVEGMELLPPYWGGFSASADDPHDARQFWTLNDLWLGPGPGGTVGIGLAGSYPEVEPILLRYAKNASEILFPSPHRIDPQLRNGHGLLLMLFTPLALQRAAHEMLGTSPP